MTKLTSSAALRRPDRTPYARLIAEHYAGPYEVLFGPLPDLGGVPDHAGPVADPVTIAAWNDLSDAKRAGVATVFAKTGKAIAACEGTILPTPTRFDALVRSPEFSRIGSLSDVEIAGEG